MKAKENTRIVTPQGVVTYVAGETIAPRHEKLIKPTGKAREAQTAEEATESRTARPTQPKAASKAKP